MRICTVWGDLSADKTDEQYPTDVYCDECFHAMDSSGEESGVVNSQDDDGSYGSTCFNCGKTADEEAEE